MDNFQAFIMMGGHAFYVWMSYGIVIVFLGLQWLFYWRQKNKSSLHE
jgi:heme exporter protein CcmD